MDKNAGRPLIGLVFLAPALVLVTTGVFGLNAPDALVHPVFVLGGVFVSLLLNVWPVLRIRLDYEEGEVVGALRLRVRGAVTNIAVLGLGVGLLGTIMLYLVAENLVAR